MLQTDGRTDKQKQRSNSALMH